MHVEQFWFFKTKRSFQEMSCSNVMANLNFSYIEENAIAWFNKNSPILYGLPNVSQEGFGGKRQL